MISVCLNVSWNLKIFVVSLWASNRTEFHSAKQAKTWRIFPTQLRSSHSQKSPRKKGGDQDRMTKSPNFTGITHFLWAGLPAVPLNCSPSLPRFKPDRIGTPGYRTRPRNKSLWSSPLCCPKRFIGQASTQPLARRNKRRQTASQQKKGASLGQRPCRTSSLRSFARPHASLGKTTH